MSSLSATATRGFPAAALTHRPILRLLVLTEKSFRGRKEARQASRSTVAKKASARSERKH